MDLCNHLYLTCQLVILHSEALYIGHYVQTFQPNSFLPSVLNGTMNLYHFQTFMNWCISKWILQPQYSVVWDKCYLHWLSFMVPANTWLKGWFCVWQYCQLTSMSWWHVGLMNPSAILFYTVFMKLENYSVMIYFNKEKERKKGCLLAFKCLQVNFLQTMYYDSHDWTLILLWIDVWW